VGSGVGHDPAYFMSNKLFDRDTFFNWVVYGMRLPIEVEPLKSESVVFGEGPYCWISNSLEKERM
jgi:hypothetical protein